MDPSPFPVSRPRSFIRGLTSRGRQRAAFATEPELLGKGRSGSEGGSGLPPRQERRPPFLSDPESLELPLRPAQSPLACFQTLCPGDHASPLNINFSARLLSHTLSGYSGYISVELAPTGDVIILYLLTAEVYTP